MGMSWLVDIVVRPALDIEVDVVTIFVFFRPSEFIILSFCRHLVTMADGDTERSSVIKT